MKKIIISVVAVVALGAAGWNVLTYLRGNPSANVHYPYVCKDCKAVFDSEELKADNLKNYRVPKGAPSDAVVHCLRCTKGWAYPVKTCNKCGTQRILYLTKDNRCPKCFPEAAEVAKTAKVDVFYHAP